MEWYVRRIFMTHFKGKQLSLYIIMVAVGYYPIYNESYLNISEILRERGVYVCHTTIYQWVQE